MFNVETSSSMRGERRKERKKERGGIDLGFPSYYIYRARRQDRERKRERDVLQDDHEDSLDYG